MTEQSFQTKRVTDIGKEDGGKAGKGGKEGEDRRKRKRREKK